MNPKPLAIDLLLIENRPSRPMFLCLLPGGLTVALTIGCWKCSSSTPMSSRLKARWARAPAWPWASCYSLPAAPLATGRLNGRRKASAPAADMQQEQRTAGRSGCFVSRPRLAMYRRAGRPAGVSYLTALHIPATGNSSVPPGRARRQNLPDVDPNVGGYLPRLTYPGLRQIIERQFFLGGLSGT